MSEYVQIAFSVDANVWREAKRVARQTAGGKLQDVVAAAIQAYLEPIEGQEVVYYPTLNAASVKAGGTEFPQRTGDIRTGYPGEDARDLVSTRVNTRLPAALHNRFYNYLYWSNEYLSHEIEKALRSYLRL